MAITVPDAARRAGRDPETIRRWIRSGRLRSTKVGTQHTIHEDDLAAVLGEARSEGLLPGWGRFASGNPMPDWVRALDQSRHGH